MNPNGESSKPTAARDEAVEMYRAFLQQVPHTGDVDFEKLCGEKADLADELRRLHSVARLAQSLAASRSFHETLREQFGDDAEVTVKLEDPMGVSRSERLAREPARAGTPNQPSRYALEGEVARGGMGVIFRVSDRDLSRTLAMKVMTGAHGPSAQATDATSRLGLARFLEEAQVTAQLDHPGIVPVHEVGFDTQGQPFFTMKLVKGRDLNEIFKLAREEKEDWNLPRAVGVVVKACQAVAFAHSKGVIHRDLKPANIMVGRFGEVFVMDWGLAKISGKKDLHDIRPKDTQLTSASFHSPRRETATESTPDSPLITMDGSVVGTPAYMPPEQARGQVEEVDQASDIYSLGAILYNLLTGQAPYVEPGARISPHTILGMVIQGAPKRVHQLNPQAPPELIAICEKAMTREKRDRYGSSLDLAEDLQAFLDHRVVKAYRTGAMAEFKSWVKRNRGMAITAGSAAVLAAAATTAILIQQHRSNARLRLNAYAADMKAAQAALQQRNRGPAAALLDRHRPNGGEADLRGIEWRYLWQATKGDEVQAWRHPSLVTGVRFSPDGKFIVSACFDGVLRVWDATARDSKPVRLIERGVNDVLREGAFCFLPGGQKLASVHRNGVVLFDCSNWQVVQTLTIPPSEIVHSTDAPSLACSPDGKWIATGSRAGIRVWETESGGSTLLQSQGAWLIAFVPGNNLLAATGGGAVVLWDVPSRTEVRRFAGISNPLRLALSAQGNWIAAGNIRGEAALWNLRTGQHVWTRHAHQSEVTTMAFSKDERRLCTGGTDQLIHLWDVSSGEKTQTLRGHLNDVYSVEFAPDDRYLVSASMDGTVKLWDLRAEPQLQQRWLESNDWPLCFSEDGRELVTIATNGPTIRHWEGTKKTKEILLEEALTLHTLARTIPSADGKNLLVGETNGLLRVYSLKTGKVSHSVKLAGGLFRIFALSPNGNWLAGKATSEKEIALSIWDCASGALHLRAPDYYGDFTSPDSIAFSEDNRLMAFGTTNFLVKVMDLASGRLLHTLRGHSWFVDALDFSPDGTCLASGSWDGTVRVWAVASGKEAMAPLNPNSSSIKAVCFSTDGKTLITSGYDYSVRFWHLATGREMLLFNEADSSWWDGESRTSLLSARDAWLVLRDTARRAVRVERIPSLAEIEMAEDGRRR